MGLLKERNVDVTPLSGKDPNGNLSFVVIDPQGHRVQFIQYLKGSVYSRNIGKHLSPSRISDHILHLGIRVKDPDRADSFYKEVLGFRLLWMGGPTDAHMDWISMLVPDGHDWVEYMVGENEPTPRQLGVMHHYCLGTLDIQAVYKKILDRGNKPPQEPHIARDGRWLMNLFDPDMTRTEVMIPKPVQTPCCSPMRDDTVGLQP